MTFWRLWLLAGLLGCALELALRRRRILQDLAEAEADPRFSPVYYAAIAFGFALGILSGAIQIVTVLVRHFFVDPRKARQSKP